MFDQLQQVVKALIYDLKAKTAAQMLPGLPAYILFMMIRSVGLFNVEGEISCQLFNDNTSPQRYVILLERFVTYSISSADLSCTRT